MHKQLKIFVLASMFFVFGASVTLASDGMPTCHLRANPNTIQAGGATTLIWWTTGGVTQSKLYPKGSDHLIKTFRGDNGWWWISGITDTREYTIKVKNNDGQTASCTTRIVVKNNDKEENNGSNEGVSSSNSDHKISKKHHRHNKYYKKYKHHKKYRGSHNKAIYKKIKNWKKHNRTMYLKYKFIYKQYKGISSKKLKKRLSLAEYKIYHEYKVYHEYKEYKHYKQKAGK